MAPYKKPKHQRNVQHNPAQSHTITHWIWSWGVVGSVVFFALSGGISFMTTGHQWIADGSYLLGGGVFVAKFLSWEAARQHPKKRRVSFIALCASFAVTVGAIAGNHYLNRPTNSSADKGDKGINQIADIPCHITVSFTSQVMSRLWGFAKLPGPGKTRFSGFQFQELFYEWHTTLKPNRELSELVVEVSNLREDDRKRIAPEPESLSELKPQWALGFEEPSRKPDYYSRTIRFIDISENDPASITIRRPLTKIGVLSEGDVINLAEARAASCPARIITYDTKEKVKKLNMQAMAFTKLRILGAGQLPFRPLPSNPPPNEVLVSGEISCANDTCDQGEKQPDQSGKFSR